MVAAGGMVLGSTAASSGNRNTSGGIPARLAGLARTSSTSASSTDTGIPQDSTASTKSKVGNILIKETFPTGPMTGSSTSATKVHDQ